MKYTAIVDGERLELELTDRNEAAVEAEIGGRKYTLELHAVEPGVYWLHWNNRSFQIAVTPDGSAYAVSVGHRRAHVEIIDPRAALKQAARHGRAGTVELRAPMPGKIVKVLADEGASVDSNQGLVVIEAMKMQNEIRSPKKGIVRALPAREGAAVNAGDLLVIVE